MRQLIGFLLVAGTLALAVGCGGGSTSSVPTAQAQVLGKVVSRDGSTSDLAGISVRSPEGGPTVLTAVDGGFDLRVPAGKRLRLRFDDPNASGGGLLEDDDIEEGGDDTPDHTDLDGDEVEISPLGDDEVCEIEVEIENGEIVEAWVERDGKGHEGRDRDGESRLRPPEGQGESKAHGEFEVECGEECCRMEVELEGLQGPDAFEIVLQGPEGDEILLGAIEISVSGLAAGRFVLEVCVGDLEVIGPEDLPEIAGWMILVLDGEGDIVLEGEIPGDGPQHDERDGCVEDFKLRPPDLSPEPNAIGGGVVRIDEECDELVIEAGELESTEVLDVVLVCEGEDAELGELLVQERGGGRFSVEYCEDDERPFGVDSLAELAGCRIDLLDGEGRVVLRGELPECKRDHDKEPPRIKAEDFELSPPDLSPEPEAEGWGLLRCGPECCLLVIEVGGVGVTEALDVVVIQPEGEGAVLGELIVGDEGGGRFAAEICHGTEDVPFGLDSLDELAGYRIDLVDGDGNVVLRGELPELGEHDHGDEEGGEEGDED